MEGLATITIGGFPERQFALNCRSTVDNGASILWSREDQQIILSPISEIDHGMQLNLSGAGQLEITGYICSNEEMQVSITVTTGELEDSINGMHSTSSGLSMTV